MLNENTTLQNGRYRIIRRIGQGGMGAVYEAYDNNLGNRVALKEALVNNETSLLRAFKREAQRLDRLRHVALPTVKDHFTEGGGQYLVMDDRACIEGQDLREMLKQRKQPFPVQDVLVWADTLLDALTYLHSRNPPLIHRDIKPANLKLTPDGQIILLDFGLAKGGLTHHTLVEGSLYGYTPGYAPPEQMEGQPTDQRSDLYALGATLYALLTGQTPDDPISRRKYIERGLPDLLLPAHQLNAQVPLYVAQVLQQATAIDSQQRPSSAAQMRAMLKGPSQPSVSIPPSATTSISRQQTGQLVQSHSPSQPMVSQVTSVSSLNTTKNNRLALLLGIVMAGILLVGVLLGAYMMGNSGNNVDNSPNAMQGADATEAIAVQTTATETLRPTESAILAPTATETLRPTETATLASTTTNTPQSTETATQVGTATQVPSSTETAILAETATQVLLPTATQAPQQEEVQTSPTTNTQARQDVATQAPTATQIPPPTATQAPPPTATQIPPPTATQIPPPTATQAPPPTATQVPPPTATQVPPPTATEVPPPTATQIPLPTATQVPLPTATQIPPPTATQVLLAQAAQVVSVLDCDDSVSKFTFQANQAIELHMIGVYETRSDHGFGNHPMGDATINLSNLHTPIVLALSSYEPTRWNLSGNTNMITRVIVAGYHNQEVTGVPASKTQIYTHDNGNFIIASAEEWSDPEAQTFKQFAEETSGYSLNSFTGCYTATQFDIRP